MTRVLGKIILGVSWLVLSFAALVGLAGGWLYYGYRNMSCNPRFAGSEAACGKLSAWASEHVLVAGRTFMPYSEILTEEREFFILSAAIVVTAALVIQVIHRIVHRRRRRHLRAFADVRGFRPIEDMEE